MVCVKDASDPAFRAKLPRWWKDAFPAVRSFIVLPLTVNRHPVGLIYGDWDDAAPVALEQSEILALNELRALVVRSSRAARGRCALGARRLIRRRARQRRDSHRPPPAPAAHSRGGRENTPRAAPSGPSTAP